MRLLLSIEANDFVLGHAVFLLACCWNSLHEANHGLVALGVEFTVVTSFDHLELIGAIHLREGRELWFDGVLEVSEETKSILKLNLERLVINGRPCAG